ncbi:hypothetical protein SK128_009746 [Halocaridina rubra]|uniref:Uncharacterized protein n=1 Tax=Halocaridina rubra TaxID=373956 RepID=A0AAN8X3H5_HALRR
MKSVFSLRIGLVTVMFLLIAKSTSESHGLENSRGAEFIGPSLEGELTEDSRQDKKILAYYFTTSSTRLVTTTVTAISTCLSIIMAPAAAPPPPDEGGRRKGRQVPCVGRRSSALRRNIENFDDIRETQSSMSNSEEGKYKYNIEPGANDSRVGRKLTFWTTAFTVMTITSTSAVPGTTVTASLLCRIPGAVNSCFLG